MCLEDKALELVEENNELKAQVNHLSELIVRANKIGCITPLIVRHAINTPPAQTLNQHNIALLNDIEQTFTNGTGTDFIDVFAAYKAKLELDNN